MRFLPVIFLFVFWGCSNKPVSTIPYSAPSKKNANILKPDFQLYKTQTGHEVYVRIKSSELLYTRPINSNQYEAHYAISFQRYEQGDKQLIDSSSFKFTELKSDKNPYYIQQKIRVPKNEKGNVLYIKVTDFTRNTDITKRLELGGSNALNKEDFLISKDGNLSYSYPFLSVGEYVMKSETYFGEKVEFQVVEPKDNLPPPIFSSTNLSIPAIRPDTSVSYYFSDSAFISFNREGSYIPVTNYPKTFVIHVFDKGFPKVRTEKALLEPLRFICSKEEYTRLKNSQDQRKEVELFWESKTKTREKARELIKEYYSRVEHANRHFTTYTQGWKTDMGMVYLIFGEPRTVRSGNNSEFWYYGDERNAQTLTFKFYKRNNATFGNYYELNRISMYKPIWMRAVDTWRSGRIYRAY